MLSASFYHSLLHPLPSLISKHYSSITAPSTAKNDKFDVGNTNVHTMYKHTIF